MMTTLTKHSNFESLKSSGSENKSIRDTISKNSISVQSTEVKKFLEILQRKLAKTLKPKNSCG